mmetsp:Transcript_65203/g.75828  ORF Transcript_65203/g.75828 Transcript_65203/m.75828 type:complete len:183 (-) Transcript_65203:143-691(-)
MKFIEDTVVEIVSMKPRKIVQQILSLLLIVSSALMIWKSFVVLSCSESPVVVVLSGSMEPAYYRGDILFLTFYETPIVCGDVVVYKIKDQDIPIVHRVISVHERDDGEAFLLTKGDNNKDDDRLLYPRGQMWLKRSDLMGKVVGYIPYAGMFTIWLNDYPMLKWVLIGTMSLLVLVAKDPQN